MGRPSKYQHRAGWEPKRETRSCAVCTSEFKVIASSTRLTCDVHKGKHVRQRRPGSGGRNRLSVQEHQARGTYRPGRHGAVAVVCTRCGISFHRVGTSQRFCDACRQGICEQCGGRFVRTTRARKYCGQACGGKARRHLSGHCSWPGCIRLSERHDLCGAHRSRKHRGLDMDAPLPVPFTMHHAPLCLVTGCGKPYKAKGLCLKHWHRQRAGLSLISQSSPRCTAADCRITTRHPLGLCWKHRAIGLRRWCTAPGCTRRLYLDAATYCAKHRLGCCKARGCDAWLRSDNVTGYCRAHWQQPKLRLEDMPEYRAWVRMKARCSNPNLDQFLNGVGVAAAWAHDFAAFFAALGSRPTPNHDLARIDLRGGYAPGNVRWEPHAQYSRRTGRQGAGHGYLGSRQS